MHQSAGIVKRERNVEVNAQPGEVLPETYCDMADGADSGRRAGVVLHPTSLPSPHGMGDLGDECEAFIDWLADAGLTLWQVLPLVPPGRPVPGVREDYWSPYSGRDANCGNVLLLSLERLADDGLIAAEDVPPVVPLGDCDFNAVAALKEPIIEKAGAALVAAARGTDASATGGVGNAGPSAELVHEYIAFTQDVEVRAWLSDAALFSAIEADPDLLGKNWWDWPEELRERHDDALCKVANEKRDEIEVFKACQFLFHRQWMAVKAYANSRNIGVVGDMPIYVGGHSADVWANRALFELDDRGNPGEVSGVPPDAFSDTGQLWGSPLYRWPAHRDEDYAWWTRRLRRAFVLYDEVRIDHFRGFAGYWAVPAENDTAMNGVWKVGPGIELFARVAEKLSTAGPGEPVPRLPIMAEDLGVITPDVTALRKAIDAPGMVVLQFAFGSGPENTHLVHNYDANTFVYPATHDNDTTVGWWRSVDEKDKTWVRHYTGEFIPDKGTRRRRRGRRDDIVDDDDIAWLMMRLAFTSVAKSAVVVMQDVLSLGSESRMNTPGVADGNWAWRLTRTKVNRAYKDEARRLRKLAYVTDRLDREQETPELVTPARWRWVSWIRGLFS